MYGTAKKVILTESRPVISVQDYDSLETQPINNQPPTQDEWKSCLEPLSLLVKSLQRQLCPSQLFLAVAYVAHILALGNCSNKIRRQLGFTRISGFQ